MSEIQPYQNIDLLLAGDRIADLAPPVKGFVVCYPDGHLDAEYVEEDCDIEALKQKVSGLIAFLYAHAGFIQSKTGCWFTGIFKKRNFGHQDKQNL